MTTYTRSSDHIVRCCSRCHKELTDPASRECGVGPLCRHKDNAIFARELPVDPSRALGFFLSLTVDDFHPHLHAEFKTRGEALVAKLCEMQSALSAFSSEPATGKDFRDMINWIDFALSYPTTNAARQKVISVVEALGYPSLAGVLRGDVSMSEARLELQGNSTEGYRLCMYGKANKDGWRAMRTKFGMRVKTPRYRGDRTPYSVALADSEDFIALALRYWPFIADENVAEVRTKIANIPAEQCSPASTQPRAALSESRLFDSVTHRQAGFQVSMPWVNGVTPQVVADFKGQIDRHGRYYQPERRTWHFRNEHKEKVLQILRSHGFRVANV